MCDCGEDVAFEFWTMDDGMKTNGMPSCCCMWPSRLLPIKPPIKHFSKSLSSNVSLNLQRAVPELKKWRRRKRAESETSEQGGLCRSRRHEGNCYSVREDLIRVTEANRRFHSKPRAIQNTVIVLAILCLASGIFCKTDADY